MDVDEDNGHDPKKGKDKNEKPSKKQSEKKKQSETLTSQKVDKEDKEKDIPKVTFDADKERDDRMVLLPLLTNFS